MSKDAQTACPRATAISPDDFLLSFSDETLIWSAESRPDLPILQWPDGQVCEPALLYFGHSAEVARVIPSSMRGEAYVIREFLCFLVGKGKRWDEPSDSLLREWREEQRKAGEVRTDGPLSKERVQPPALPSKVRIERKIAIVVEFYRLVPEAICLDRDNRPFPKFVGPPKASRLFPINTKRVTAMTPFGPSTRDCWIGAHREIAGSTMKPIPREGTVSSVLAGLRGRAAACPTARPTLTAGDQSRLGADRSWLIGCCQARAGLRSEEVARLTIPALAKALGEEGIRLGPGPSSSNAAWLAGLTPDQAARERIVDELDDLADNGRREIGIEVTCKRRKRKAPFPIDLVIDLLTIGLWTTRDGQVRNWASRRSNYVPPETVFLSFKTGLALTPGAVGDLVKDAFAAAGVAGSGHRLRAYFGDARAQRLILDRLEMNGFVYDASVEKWVLEKVADAMGHAKTSTTVRHYVDQAAMRITGKSAQGASAGMTGVRRALAARNRLLCDNDFKEIEALIERLSSERRRT